MEKEMVQTYQITWADANKGLELARTKLEYAAQMDDLMRAAYDCLRESEEYIRKQAERKAAEQKTAEKQLAANLVNSNEKICLCITDTENIKLSLPRDGVPVDLANAGVALADWVQIWDSMEQSWAPALAKVATVDKITLSTLNKSVTDNAQKNKALKLVMASSHTMAALSLVASNSLALANFLLNPLGVLVQLESDKGQKFFKNGGGEDLPYFQNTTFVKPVGLTIKIMREPRKSVTSTQENGVSNGTHHAQEEVGVSVDELAQDFISRTEVQDISTSGGFDHIVET